MTFSSHEPRHLSPGPLARTSEPPYFAVIFSSLRNAEDAGYDATARRMVEIATEQPGFLGMESARSPEGFGITVSYWTSEEAIAAWKTHAEHAMAQEAGKSIWYAEYQLRVARVERAYGKPASAAP